MSRSVRKAIVREKSFKCAGNYNKKTRSRWSRVRSKINTVINSSDNIEELEIPNAKTIHNKKFKFENYKLDFEHTNKEEDKFYKQKFKRK